MFDELILRFKKPPLEILLKSFREVICEKLQELNPEITCIISKEIFNY
jgi:hypothetical protein